MMEMKTQIRVIKNKAHKPVLRESFDKVSLVLIVFPRLCFSIDQVVPILKMFFVLTEKDINIKALSPSFTGNVLQN